MRRVLWNPLLAAGCLAFLTFRLATVGANWVRIAGVVVCGVWFALAVYDRYSGGKFVAGLYSDDDA